MIETEVLNVLTAALAPVPVSMEVPSPMPGTFVVLEKTGTSRTDHITTSAFAVQSWAPTVLDAARLNEQAKAAMDAAAGAEQLLRQGNAIFLCHCAQNHL